MYIPDIIDKGTCAGLGRWDGEDPLFALIRAGTRCPEGLAAKILSFACPRYGIRVGTVRISGVRIPEAVVDLPSPETGKRATGRMETALRDLKAMGATTVIAAEDIRTFPVFSRFPLRSPDRLKLLRRMAGRMALFALGPGARYKTAALYADRLSSDFDMTVRYLLPRIRNIAIRCGTRRDVYAAGLLAEYGIPVLTNSGAFDSADLHIFFDMPAGPVFTRADSAALCLCGENLTPGCRVVRDAVFDLPKRLEVPDDYPHGELVAALFEIGAVHEDELSIRRLI